MLPRPTATPIMDMSNPNREVNLSRGALRGAESDMVSVIKPGEYR